ncbi:hypothetical protein [Thioalkalivibrio sp.]|uniref:hypothetical protein n=1 Tax=Thioalkalivibrio sp. TaxID=2093813 RepID=UPI0035686552
MSNVIRKEEAHRLVDQLSADSTWEDLMREIYVREAIEKGLEDVEAGRTDELGEVRRRFGLPE